MASQPFSRLISAEIDGRTQNTRYRQNQFHRLQSVLVDHIDEIKEAIQVDSGHGPEEAQAEICLALQELRTHYCALNLEQDLEKEYRAAAGKDNVDAVRGVGIVYIVPCTHTIFFSVTCALSAAIAAGNCVIVELTKTTMAIPALLRKILPQALDADSFAVSEERPDKTFLSNAIMILQNDGDSEHIPGRRLMSPMTKRTAAIVDRTANLDHAAQALVEARFAFGGRSPYSPDVVFVHEFGMKSFVEAVIQHSSKYLSGQNGQARQIATARPTRHSSLETARKDPCSRVLVSGSTWGVVEANDRKSPLLQGKINEKLLVLHSITSLDDAIDFSTSNGTLAATYIFASLGAAKYLAQFTDAHVSWVNHVPSDVLIGPAFPADTSPSFKTRYAVGHLQVPRPQVLTEKRNTSLVRAVLDTASQKEAVALWQEAISPLPSTKQRPGWSVGFFEQGIITGGIITLVSFVATVSTLGYYTFTYARGR